MAAERLAVASAGCWTSFHLANLGSNSMRRWWPVHQLENRELHRVEGYLAPVKAQASPLSLWRKRQVLRDYLVPNGQLNWGEVLSFFNGFESYSANLNYRKKTCPIPTEFVNLEGVWKVHQTLNSTDGSVPIFKLVLKIGILRSCRLSPKPRIAARPNFMGTARLSHRVSEFLMLLYWLLTAWHSQVVDTVDEALEAVN